MARKITMHFAGREATKRKDRAPITQYRTLIQQMLYNSSSVADIRRYRGRAAYSIVDVHNWHEGVVTDVNKVVYVGHPDSVGMGYVTGGIVSDSFRRK